MSAGSNIDKAILARAERCRHGRFRGFTLIELLVVVAILALLVAILLPSLQKARALAQQAVCMNSLRQINLVFNLYHADHGGLYPPHLITVTSSNPQDYRWYGNLVREGYPLTRDLLYCPAGRQYDERLTQHYYIWGMFDHGYSLGLTFDYGDPTSPHKPAQVDKIVEPSSTIAVLDTRVVRAVPANPLTEQGRYFCDGVYRYTSTWDAGIAVARHLNKCDVGWVDGHVSMVEQPDADDDSTLYSEDALTNYHLSTNYWDRE